MLTYGSSSYTRTAHVRCSYSHASCKCVQVRRMCVSEIKCIQQHVVVLSSWASWSRSLSFICWFWYVGWVLSSKAGLAEKNSTAPFVAAEKEQLVFFLSPSFYVPLSHSISCPDSLASLSECLTSSLLSPSYVAAFFVFRFATFFGGILKTSDAMNRRLNIYILLRLVRTKHGPRTDNVLITCVARRSDNGIFFKDSRRQCVLISWTYGARAWTYGARTSHVLVVNP